MAVTSYPSDLEKNSSVQMDDVVLNEKDLKSSAAVEGGDYSGAVAKTDPAEIALVRKLDFRIMPALFCLYFLNKLDQNAIANARLNGLEKDLGLKKTQYNTCISILYVGYLFAQIPSNMLMSSKKVRPSLYMALCAGIWGAVACLTAVVKNYTGLVLVRFFLGFVEAPFYPGALYILSLFYTRKEIATRVSILYAGNIFAVSFAGLIAAAVFATLDDKHGMHGWQWLFIIEGLVTIGVAIICVFLLPDEPLTTRWLTPEERQLAHDRMHRDTVGAEQGKGARAGFMQALRDPRLYLFVFMQNMHLSATSFNQVVVSSLGFTTTITLVLTAPPSLVAGVVGIAVGISSGKFNERTWHISAMMGLATVGFVISAVTLNVAARYISCFLFASGVYSVNSVILGWVSGTLGQTPEKKAVSLSMVNMVSMASFIYTPYLYPKSDGPKYVIAMSANASFAFATVAAAWAMRVWLQTQNRRLKREGGNVYYAY
ncbi:MFS general substrate transporter [Paraphaeosphaeria sporulosa]|uniref:MFS general substrate transporter n=1 Tax=Paraphaeosphaeria sporulosa TaxID=1460663 RepID=A0A177CWL6_9PLEO|nr:MFS general substrate transporter [Paraphaeosphaeria sporulosa]OAG11129.1 MFS general substrate transporter [Paraphaeosphaeria sporulosa]